MKSKMANFIFFSLLTQTKILKIRVLKLNINHCIQPFLSDIINPNREFYRGNHEDYKKIQFIFLLSYLITPIIGIQPKIILKVGATEVEINTRLAESSEFLKTNLEIYEPSHTPSSLQALSRYVASTWKRGDISRTNVGTHPLDSFS